MKTPRSFEEHHKILLKNPEYRKALKETELEYQVARQLIIARINKKLSQATLSKKMKTKQSVISRVESGNHLPSLSFLKRLAHAMGTTVSISFGG